MEKYTQLTTLYQTEQVKVKKCLNKEDNKIYCIKVLPVSCLEDITYLFQEIMNLYAIKEMPEFIQFIEYFLEGQETRVETICIVTEYCEKGDLAKEFKRREKANHHFSDKEIEFHIIHLLSGFEKLQLRNIFHRDIKPENIFISNDGYLKIGDLGSCNTRNSSEKTLIGSPFYMSPEMKNYFFDFNRGSIGPRVNYDAVRSDVWSLGLTFLYMITLKNVSEFYNLQNVSTVIHKRLSEIKNPAFKVLLSNMIKVSPSERLDFVGLNKLFKEELIKASVPIVNQNLIDNIGRNYKTYEVIDNNPFVHKEENNFSNIPPSISKPFDQIHKNFGFNSVEPEHISKQNICCWCNLPEKLLNCKHCAVSVHPYCLAANRSCYNCKYIFLDSDFNLNCLLCQRKTEVSLIKYCNHLYCGDCQSKAFQCKYCFEFEIINEIGELNVGDRAIYCKSCRNQLEFRGSHYYCSIENH